MTGNRLMQEIGGQQSWRNTGTGSKKSNPSENRNDNPLWKKSARKVRYHIKKIDLYDYD